MFKQGHLIVSLFFSTAVFAHCPLSTDAKKLVEEAVVRNTLESKWILSNSHPGDSFQSRGFARNLIGWSNSFLGSLTLAQQCEGPTTFDKFCEPACLDNEPDCTLERCSQLGCERAGVDTIKLWWQPSPVNYRTDSPNIPKFNVTYRLRPTTHLRFDGRNPGKLLVSWAAKDTVSAKKVTGSSRLNATSTLIASGISTTQTPEGASLFIRYPYLSGSGTTRVHMKLNGHGEVSGTVALGGSKLANILPGSTEEEVAKIQWVGSCR